MARDTDCEISSEARSRLDQLACSRGGAPRSVASFSYLEVGCFVVFKTTRWGGLRRDSLC
jgi:hypothetical protein